MKKIITVFKKEAKDNLRDKRSFFFSLIYGPIVLPLIIVGSMIAGIKTNIIDFEKTTTIAIIGQERAPNFIQYLRENNIEAIAAPQDYLQKIKDGDLDLVVEISDHYAEHLREGKPAIITFYVNQSDKDSEKSERHLRSIINTYDQKLGKLRMMARGFDAQVLNTINIVEEDLSSEGRKGQVLGSLIPFIIIFSMLMGGFYLAVDTTAGERERHSLEPLLSLPISRAQMVLGKYFAVFLFVTLSGLLSAVSLYLVFNAVPIDELRGILNFSAATMSTAYLLAFPLAFMISGLLILVSAYTRSTKEAQTYLGIMMIIPMIPFFLLQFMKIKTTLANMAIPLFSQYQLLEKVMKSESITTKYVLASVFGTALMAILLLISAIALYRQDRILQ